MSNLKGKIKELPQSPGVYQFLDASGDILYVGKAKNIRNRIKSYFAKEIGRGPAIDLMVQLAVDIKTIETESEIEAVILEADLIGKLKPKYNIRLRDDKSFLMIRITKPKVGVSDEAEVKSKNRNLCATDVSRVELVRYKNADLHDKSAWYFGPYPAGDLLKKSLRYLRRIFPYMDCTNTKYNRYSKFGRACLYGDLGICPAPCVAGTSREEYQKNITYLKNFLRGNKKEVRSKLEKEMHRLSKTNHFEQAAIIRDRIYALDHISDVAVGIKDDFTSPGKLAFQRIECYDMSNISGQYAVGSMVVFANGEPDKDEYRRFRIKNKALSVLGYEGGDTGMMAEVLERRLNNSWPLPNLLIVDGGPTHVTLATRILKSHGLDIPVAGIAKGPKRDKDEFHFSNHAIAAYIKKNPEIQIICIKARNEAHRFARDYYRKLHSKNMLQ
ncbi:MAG: GIY-YIG nuclease family protein [Patescibacteria group bacterium]|jgi:excinuclease ABC subunit C